ncbi:hypothetical protein GCM10023214_15830 [Amycolatopsis dongchuanensis]|uniref:Helix-turn-helix domain-containing protein n=1 Tax=Amycolatopsis dongchuanensis TaxID=1070866 RepID=A0ABP9Q554_9PSEU
MSEFSLEKFSADLNRDHGCSPVVFRPPAEDDYGGQYEAWLAGEATAERAVSGGVPEFEFRKAVLRSDMPTTRKLVALVVASYATPSTGDGAHPKQSTVASQASLGTDKAARVHMRALEESGWLVVTRRLPKGVKVYRLAIPDRSLKTGVPQDPGPPGPVTPGAQDRSRPVPQDRSHIRTQ